MGIIPQLITIIFWGMALGIHLKEHGTPRTGNHSIWPFLLALPIQAALLYWGGYFDDLIRAMIGG